MTIGLVLAAGAGRRLRPYTDTLPKALVPVVDEGRGDDERSILDLTLSNYAAVGLTDVVVIVGYQADAVRDRVATLEARHGVNLELVFNDKAETWNNAYSLWCAREHFARGFLLANGDTVHPAEVQRTVLAARGPDIVLALDQVKPLADEEMKVQLSPDGALTRITKLMDPSGAAGEYIGLTLVEPAAADRLADALETTFTRDPDLYYEDGYQELVDRGVRIDVAPIGTVDWVEVDNHDDLARAREIACRY